MDASMFDGQGCQASSRSEISAPSSMKASLTLNLNVFSKPTGTLSCLGIDSPDFERLIASPADLLSAGTPTTQKILFPKLVTEEQEAYARGFVDALEELHKRQLLEHNLPDSGGADDSLSLLITVPSAGDICGIASTFPALTDIVKTEPVSSISDPLTDVIQPIATVILPSSNAILPVTDVSGAMQSVVTNAVTELIERGSSMLYQPTCVSAAATSSSKILDSKLMSVASKFYSVQPSGSSVAGLAGHCYVIQPMHTTHQPSTVGQLTDSNNLLAARLLPGSGLGTLPVVSGAGGGSVSINSWLEESARQQQQQPPNCESVEAEELEHIGSGRQEHKRARNRLAAQRCRMRKIERISELSERVDELRSENNRLLQSSVELQNYVTGLKQQILDHVHKGCRVMLVNNTDPR